jgi:hypothetical protein
MSSNERSVSKTFRVPERLIEVLEKEAQAVDSA